LNNNIPSSRAPRAEDASHTLIGADWYVSHLKELGNPQIALSIEELPPLFPQRGVLAVLGLNVRKV
jgi:hypothetical protein